MLPGDGGAARLRMTGNASAAGSPVGWQLRFRCWPASHTAFPVRPVAWHRRSRARLCSPTWRARQHSRAAYRPAPGRRELRRAPRCSAAGSPARSSPAAAGASPPGSDRPSRMNTALAAEGVVRARTHCRQFQQRDVVWPATDDTLLVAGDARHCDEERMVSVIVTGAPRAASSTSPQRSTRPEADRASPYTWLPCTPGPTRPRGG